MFWLGLVVGILLTAFIADRMVITAVRLMTPDERACLNIVLENMRERFDKRAYYGQL